MSLNFTDKGNMRSFKQCTKICAASVIFHPRKHGGSPPSGSIRLTKSCGSCAFHKASGFNVQGWSLMWIWLHEMWLIMVLSSYSWSPLLDLDYERYETVRVVKMQWSRGILLPCGTILGVRLDVRRKYTPFVDKFETKLVHPEFQADRGFKICVWRYRGFFNNNICVSVSSFSPTLSKIKFVL